MSNLLIDSASVMGMRSRVLCVLKGLQHNEIFKVLLSEIEIPHETINYVKYEIQFSV